MTRYLVVMGLFALLLVGCGKEEAPEEKAETDAAQEAPAAISEQAAEAMDSLEETTGEAEEAISEEAQALAEEAEEAVEQGVAEAESTAEELAAEAEEAATAAAEADTARGKEVYDSTCFVCHGTGAAGAPVLGDKAAWEPRIAQGMEVLVSNSINGIRGMPPKGGSMQLSDEDMAAAVAYMVEQSK